MEFIHFRSRSRRLAGYDYRGIVGKIILVLCFFFIGNWLEAHPLKMSVANLSYDVSKKSYLLDLRMFLDDFLVVSGDLPADANPFGQVLSVPSKSEVRDYLARHLIIYFNDQPIEVKADKVKTEDLTIYVTFAIKTDLLPEAITRIRIEDTIYTDAFVNQRNIVHIDLPGKQRKSLLFNRYQQEDTASW